MIGGYKEAAETALRRAMRIFRKTNRIYHKLDKIRTF